MNPFYYCTGTHISRRTMLRGLGVTMALPFLDAMRPAFAKEPAGTLAPARFVGICTTLGIHQPFLIPEKSGRDYALTPYLSLLKEHRDRLTVISGIAHQNQNGGNGHTTENTWLTAAAHPGLVGFCNTISVDQVMAAHLGPTTRVPYLALSTGGNSMSWTSSGVQIPGESSPAKVFAKLFIQGTPAQIAEQRRQLERGHSVLDTIHAQAKRLHRDLGARDQEKLDQYLTSVRNLESDLSANNSWLDRPKPQVDAKQPKDINERGIVGARIRQMSEVMTLALQTDSTRVITYRINGLSTVPDINGVTLNWHELSHHGQDEKKIAELRLIEEEEFKELAIFLSALRAVKENNATLLDNTAVMYGSNLGNASNHDWKALPIVLAGGGFKHGSHLAFDPKNAEPLSNLFVQLLQKMGVETDKFGTNTSTSVSGLT